MRTETVTVNKMGYVRRILWINRKTSCKDRCSHDVCTKCKPVRFLGASKVAPDKS